jgi:hypothetical protein
MDESISGAEPLNGTTFLSRLSQSILSLQPEIITWRLDISPNLRLGKEIATMDTSHCEARWATRETKFRIATA